ncbi:hypothetical protein HK101_007412 [Irineochytrium annulatum]|nr:hypothetical protein HK101_007412 [Irineochytrium annulatum]
MARSKKRVWALPDDHSPGGAYLTALDGVEIFYNVWKPTGIPKAAVLALHGIGEHILRYDHVFKRFAEAGILVKGMDYRGHGRTLAKTGAPAFTIFDKVFEDLLLLDAIPIDPSYPENLPTFVMGHSLGGLLALAFSLHHSSKLRSKNFRGVISQAPPIRDAKPTSFSVRIVAKLFGVHVMPRLSHTNMLSLDGLCSSDEVLVSYREDPLVHDLITLRLCRDIFISREFLDSIAGAASFKCPYLMYFSRDDTLVDVEGGRVFYRQSGSKDKTFKEFSGVKHERE